MTAHKTVLLEGQARDDAAEIERLKGELKVCQNKLKASGRYKLRERAERAEAERARISAESLARAKKDGERVKALLAQIDALREIVRAADALRGWEVLHELPELMAAYDAARGKR